MRLGVLNIEQLQLDYCVNVSSENPFYTEAFLINGITVNPLTGPNSNDGGIELDIIPGNQSIYYVWEKQDDSEFHAFYKGY